MNCTARSIEALGEGSAGQVIDCTDDFGEKV